MSPPVFVDTSALYAVLDRQQQRSADAALLWNRLLDRDVGMMTHSAVITECSALVQKRLGMAALRDLHDRLLRLVDVTWVDGDLHDRAVTALLAAGRRDVSLVDWTSFEVMRSLAITTAFAFDDDFVEQGFELLSA